MAVPPRHDVLGRLRGRLDGLGGWDGGCISSLGRRSAAIFGLERSFESLRGLGERGVCREAAYSREESGETSRSDVSDECMTTAPFRGLSSDLKRSDLVMTNLTGA